MTRRSQEATAVNGGRTCFSRNRAWPEASLKRNGWHQTQHAIPRTRTTRSSDFFRCCCAAFPPRQSGSKLHALPTLAGLLDPVHPLHPRTHRVKQREAFGVRPGLPALFPSRASFSQASSGSNHTPQPAGHRQLRRVLLASGRQIAFAPAVPFQFFSERVLMKSSRSTSSRKCAPGRLGP